MNHKQKLGYILLGAGVMAVGITIGQFITPNIEAQSNGVFDKIVCRELEVVGKDGKKGILLQTNRAVPLPNGGVDFINQVEVFSPQDKHMDFAGVRLIAFHSGFNGVQVFDKQGEIAAAVTSTDEGNAISITNSQGDSAILLVSRDEDNSVRIYNQQGDHKEAMRFSSSKFGNMINLFDQQEKTGVALHAGAEKLDNGGLIVGKTDEITTLGD